MYTALYLFRVTRFGNFVLIGLLLKTHCIFLKNEVFKNADILGYFLFTQYFLYFHLKSTFKTGFDVGIFSFQSDELYGVFNCQI